MRAFAPKLWFGYKNNAVSNTRFVSYVLMWGSKKRQTCSCIQLLGVYKKQLYFKAMHQWFNVPNQNFRQVHKCAEIRSKIA